MCYPLPVPTRTNRPGCCAGASWLHRPLLLAEAVRRGHRPVLAGRNAAKLAALATQYDLDWLALDLDYAERLNKTIERFTLVFHAAGPFIHTSEPMVRACLAGQTHYLDITGELPVFEATFARDASARAPASSHVRRGL
ncbi:MAG: saccharopine dehydrogenase NADP-binding domain-containing protein [Candidatus Promineofilum sp.]|nr:saccharopine dehydrogenase NADP-binding domain-containing protein [Promineifilum sp.]